VKRIKDIENRLERANARIKDLSKSKLRRAKNNFEQRKTAARLQAFLFTSLF